MNAIARPALVLFVMLTLITGVMYPLATTGIAQALFPSQATGSLIERDGKLVGSALVGQHFNDPKNFWGRPSATAPMPYNGAASGGSNQGSNNPALIDAVKSRIQALQDADPGNPRAIPVDLVTASASGLDPHVSVAGARYQAARVARLRDLPQADIEALIDRYTEGRLFGLFGEPRVNILQLNIALQATSR